MKSSANVTTSPEPLPKGGLAEVFGTCPAAGVPVAA